MTLIELIYHYRRILLRQGQDKAEEFLVDSEVSLDVCAAIIATCPEGKLVGGLGNKFRLMEIK